jgi:hypothetical protein
MANLWSGGSPDREQIGACANALLGQIAQRLNFYGQPYNHVDLVSLDYYLNTLPVNLQAGVDIETSYNNYVSESASQDQQRVELNSMLADSQKQLGSLNTSAANLKDKIDDYQQAVSQLKLARNLQGQAFAEAEATWEQQVINQLQSLATAAACKTFSDILTTLGNVLSVSGKDGLQGITAKFDLGTVGKAIPVYEDFANWDDAVKRLATAQGDLDSIVSAANDLVADAVAGDSSKIAVDRATFESMLEPFKKLDATGEFEDQLNLYLAKAQAFSQKQFDYNSLQVDLVNLNAKIAQAQAQLADIKNKLNKTSDPTIAIYKAFMARMYGLVLDDLIRDVYGLVQAYRYWALDDYTLPPTDGNWTVTYLQEVQVDLSQKVTDYLNGFGGNGTAVPTQAFDYRVHGGAGWVIDDQNNHQQLEAFKKAGDDGVYRLDFPISLHDPWVKEYFAGFAQVVATAFTATIRGAATESGQLFVHLLHNGQAPFTDRHGNDWLFSHIPVSNTFEYKLDDGTVLGGGGLSGTEGKLIGLSPFTTWTLEVRPADNPGLDVSQVDQIVLKFAGRYLASEA